MEETKPLRYQIDLRIIPMHIRMRRDAFIKQFLLNPCEYLAFIYSQECKRIQGEHAFKQFSKTDFTLYQKEYPDDTKILYVSTPTADDGSSTYCIAYAIVMGPGWVRLFMINRKQNGSTYFRAVLEREGHVIWDRLIPKDVLTSTEEMMEFLHNRVISEQKTKDAMEKETEGESKVEVRRSVRPDGSYTESITDHKNKRAEIREYDAEGNCLNSIYLLL